MLFIPKVYVAAAFSKRLEASELAHQLNNRGFNTTSRWVNEHKPENSDSDKFYQHEALMDFHDVVNSDFIVRITDTEELKQELVNSKLITGSRFVEMGIALGKGIPVLVVGGKQCLFDYLPQVRHFNTNQDLFDYLNMYKGENE